MESREFISYFSMYKYKFNNSHTAGSVISFSRPCIGYIIKGGAEFLYKGRVIKAKSGDLVYIAADTKYYSVWNGTPTVEWYSVDFSYFKRSAHIDYRFQIVENYPSEYFEKMYENYETDSMKAVGYFYLILSDLYKKMKADENYHGKSLISPAIEYIEDHYSENISIEKLARLCHCSRSRLHSAFKEITGVSPVNYRHNIAVQHALDELKHTGLSIDEISIKLGFSSSNYFRRIFFKVTGKTPKEIRREG